MSSKKFSIDKKLINNKLLMAIPHPFFPIFFVNLEVGPILAEGQFVFLDVLMEDSSTLVIGK